MGDLVVGQLFYGVIGELIIDSDTNRRRVITIPGQAIEAGVFIECSKSIRDSNAIGTLFKIN